MNIAWALTARRTMISVRNKRDTDMFVELDITFEIFDVKYVSSADRDSQYWHPMEKILRNEEIRVQMIHTPRQSHFEAVDKDVELDHERRCTRGRQCRNQIHKKNWFSQKWDIWTQTESKTRETIDAWTEVSQIWESQIRLDQRCCRSDRNIRTPRLKKTSADSHTTDWEKIRT